MCFIYSSSQFTYLENLLLKIACKARVYIHSFINSKNSHYFYKYAIFQLLFYLIVQRLPINKRLFHFSQCNIQSHRRITMRIKVHFHEISSTGFFSSPKVLLIVVFSSIIFLLHLGSLNLFLIIKLILRH